MAGWVDECSEPDFLIYLLEHEYPDASLAADRPKGNDSRKVQSVARLAEQANLVCYLASVEKTVSGGADEDDRWWATHEIYDESESSVKLTRIVDLEGKQVLADAPVEEEDFVQDDPFDRVPDDEEYSGWTGNEGAEATHWYRNTVSTVPILHRSADLNISKAMVLIPREFLIDLFMKPFKPVKSSFDSSYRRDSRHGKKLCQFMSHKRANYEAHPSEAAKQNLERLCHIIVVENAFGKQQSKSRARAEFACDTMYPYPDEVLGLIAQISLSLGWPLMAQLAVAAVEEHIPSVDTLTCYFNRYTFTQLRDWQDFPRSYRCYLC